MFETHDGPEVAYDGEQIWVVPYGFDQPKFRDGPLQLMWFHYGMVALPFMTQVEGVRHEYAGIRSLPGKERQYDVVQMSFHPENKTHSGVIDLYIDRETSRLKAWTQGTRMPILPGDVLPREFQSSGGDTLRVIDEYQDIDGLIIARSYASIAGNGSQVTGAHLILNPSIKQAFDEAALKRPPGSESYPFGPSGQ